MNFAQPMMLYFLAALAILLPLAIAYWRKNQSVNRLFYEGNASRLRHTVLFFAAVILVGSGIVMLARPYKQTESLAMRAEIVALVDVSMSMAARPTPQEPSRLENAQKALLRIADEIPDVRIQIVPFTLFTFPITDFTADRIQLRESIEGGLFTENTARGGSWVFKTLLLIADEKEHNPDYENVNHIILFSDGATSESRQTSFSAVVDRLNEVGLSVSAIGFGSASGEMIPILDKDGDFSGSYFSKKDGELFVPVTVYLDEDTLTSLTSATGGIYMGQDNVSKFIREFRDMLPGEVLEGFEYSVPEQKDLSWIFAIIFTLSFGVLCARGALP